MENLKEQIEIEKENIFSEKEIEKNNWSRGYGKKNSYWYSYW